MVRIGEEFLGVLKKQNWILTNLSNNKDKNKTNAAFWRRVIGELCNDEKQHGGTLGI